MYLDIDSSCPDFNKVLSVANENHANVLLTREGNPSRYIANRKATVMWGFISSRDILCLRALIRMVWDNMNFDQPRGGDCSSRTKNEGVDVTVYRDYCVFTSSRYDENHGTRR